MVIKTPVVVDGRILKNILEYVNIFIKNRTKKHPPFSGHLEREGVGIFKTYSGLEEFGGHHPKVNQILEQFF